MQHRPGQHALQQFAGTCDRKLQSGLHLPLLWQDFRAFWQSLPDDLCDYRRLYLSCDTTAGSHVLDEAERSLHDALCVLSQTVQDARVIYGGGFPEMQMAKVSMWHCHASSCFRCARKRCSNLNVWILALGEFRLSLKTSTIQRLSEVLVILSPG